MFIPVIAIISAIAMGLSVVSTAINMKTIVEMETDRYYVAETEKLLAEQYNAAEEKLEMARFQNDPMAVAEYETLLKNIRLLRDRSNVVAIGRQVEQKKATFIKEQWDVFVADMSIRAVTWGMGKVGFGKVTDTFMRGRTGHPVQILLYGTRWPDKVSASFSAANRNWWPSSSAMSWRTSCQPF